jgi:ribosomal protein S18 acetylase RimI-like enzyme
VQRDAFPRNDYPIRDVLFASEPIGIFVSTSSEFLADDGAPRGPEVLDNAVFASLTGPHAHLAQRCGRAVRYSAEVAGFAALAGKPEPDDWTDLATLADTPDGVALTNYGAEAPADWTELSRFTVVQMTDEGAEARADRDVVRLTDEDVPDMLDLIAQTKPGPFARRTIELGSYIGLREAGRLIAMAGERFRPPGWTEISAVCTAPEHRGRGLATRLMQTLAHGIRERGDTPFLHVTSSNTNAIGLYETMGYAPRRSIEVVVLRPPGRRSTPTGR